MSAFQIQFRVNVQKQRRALPDAAPTAAGAAPDAPDARSAPAALEAEAEAQADAPREAAEGQRPQAGAGVAAGDSLARVLLEGLENEEAPPTVVAAPPRAPAEEASKGRPAAPSNASQTVPPLAQAVPRDGKDDATPHSPALQGLHPIGASFPPTIITGTIDWDPEFSPRTIIALLLIVLVIAAYMVVSGRLKADAEAAAKLTQAHKGVDRFCSSNKLDRLDHEHAMGRHERASGDDARGFALSSSLSTYTVNFKAAKLPTVGSSFAIPLTTIYECKADRLSFDVAAEPGGAIQAAYNVVLTRMGPGGVWAKIEVCATGAADALSVPIVSCHFEEGGAEFAEGYNVQGALLSWQSLLMQEKGGADAAAGSAHQAPKPSPPRDLFGVQGRGPGARKGLPTLELRDCFGRCNGQLRPSEGVLYDLWQQGERTLTIERSPDTHWIAASKDGKEQALATLLPGTRPSGSKDPHHDEEFLQVDVEALSCGNAEEPALLLLCVLAVVTFGTPFSRVGSQNFNGF